jgi:hypothetical protein
MGWAAATEGRKIEEDQGGYAGNLDIASIVTTSVMAGLDPAIHAFY